MTMTDLKTATTDPICGMTVDKATALHEERDGRSFSFYSEGCRQMFLSAPAGATPENKSGCCCEKKRRFRA
jgi:YHS domain-containing protein